MKVKEALSLYKIPFAISETRSGAGFTSYKLTPCGSSATPERLRSKLNALRIATGLNLDIITDNNELYLRHTTQQAVYNYFDYNGYINYNDERIPFLVGFNQSGVILDDIASARHMLIAGTTGSGKSVFLHDLITTFICNDNCYVYLVDCKRCEFNVYKDHAQLAFDVFGEKSATVFCNSVIDVMESRFKDFTSYNVVDFSEYKKVKPDERRHILIIDELADLIHDKKSEKAVIPKLLRIAQKGRAAGVHLILSTQRPDASIINGTLKNNMPTRVSFRTISGVDSRIILDQSGAERLNGNGDGLYLKNGAYNLTRFQAPFIDLETIQHII